MASKSPLTLCTPRDRELFTALSRCPLTAELLLKASQTFSEPYTNERYLRRRLQLLCGENWVKREQYATTSRGALNYYVLTPEGFRILHGPKATLPNRRYFSKVAPALQQHTMALSEFIVHLAIAAHRSDARITDFHRENEIHLVLGNETVIPDCCFRLKSRVGKLYNFLVELDNATEPVRSTKQRESWQRKLSFYERYQDHCNKRFRVLVVTTQETERLGHILQLAAKTARNALRRTVIGTSLTEFLASEHAVTAPIFKDHLGGRQALLPAGAPSDDPGVTSSENPATDAISS